MVSDLIRELPSSVSIKRSKPSCFSILAGGRFFEDVHGCDEVCHRLFRARCQRLLEKSVTNDRTHFHEIHADNFERSMTRVGPIM
jgi:hypothetical protein